MSQNGGNGPPTVEMGVLLIGRGVAYRKTGTQWDIVHLHHRLPPRATVHPLSTSSSLHLRLFIRRLLFIQPPPLLHRLLFNLPSPRGPVQLPLHGLLFIHPSTGYCSTSPARGPIHPALRGVLFIHPQPARSGSCSSSGNGLYYHGVLFIQPPPRTIHQTTKNAHYSSRGSRFDRLQLAAVAKESLDRVQLTANDRSIARVQ